MLFVWVGLRSYPICAHRQSCSAARTVWCRLIFVDMAGAMRPIRTTRWPPSRLEVMGQLQTYDRTDLFLAQLLETAARPAGLFG
jgi:hypothetical protein